MYTICPFHNTSVVLECLYENGDVLAAPTTMTNRTSTSARF